MSYIIAFFKAILIFIGLLFAVFLPGYLVQAILKWMKIRIVGVVLTALLLLILGITEPLGLIYGVFYVVASIVFLSSVKNLKKGYKKIKFVSKELDMSWAALYSCFLPFVIVVMPDSSLSGVVRWSLYIILLIFLLIPITSVKQIMKKIVLIEQKIIDRQVITPSDIIEIVKSLLSENDKEEDRQKKLKEIIEIIDYFVEQGELITLRLESFDTENFHFNDANDSFVKNLFNVYMIPLQNTLFEQKMDEIIELKEVIMEKILAEELKLIVPVEEEFLFDLIKTRMSKKEQWIKIENYYMKQTFISQIVDMAQNQCELFGDYDISQMGNKFLISSDAVEEALQYRKFEYKNLNFTKNKETVDDNHSGEEKIESLEGIEEFKKIEGKKIKKIDINHCSERELSEVPSMGIVFAKKAIRYREEIGGYRDVEHMLSYLGVKPHLVEQMKLYLSCDVFEKKNREMRSVGRRVEL